MLLLFLLGVALLPTSWLFAIHSSARIDRIQGSTCTIVHCMSESDKNYENDRKRYEVSCDVAKAPPAEILNYDNIV